MENSAGLTVIARMKSGFASKFGIPRQSGLVKELKSEVVFEPEFSNPDFVRGLDQFSHIWLLWGFSAVKKRDISPTVRPPRLGGNTRVGVFATRSPFRPNSIGLSCVKLDAVEHTGGRLILHVSGADLMDDTPIYDIKPYLAYADCHSDASCGFAGGEMRRLNVVFDDAVEEKIPADVKSALCGILACDPRPAYQDNPDRVYGFSFYGIEVKFRVRGDTLTVVGALPEK